MNFKMSDLSFARSRRGLAQMGTPSKVIPLVVLICSGCVTGPKYVAEQRADSAAIEGPVVPVQGPEDGTSTVEITRVDGLATAFTASRVGLNWPFFSGTKPLYVSPGQHTLGLKVGEIDENYGNVGGGQVGVVGAYAAAAKPAITATFAANHVYRFTANLDPSGSAIEVILWDETGGVAIRSRVADWTMYSNGGYSENALPARGRR